MGVAAVMWAVVYGDAVYRLADRQHSAWRGMYRATRIMRDASVAVRMRCWLLHTVAFLAMSNENASGRPACGYGR